MSLKKRSEVEIKNAIRDQLIYIQNSCDLFDGGCQAEAIRIAASINILLENRKRSSGILIKIDRDFKLLSTVPDVESVDLDKLITLQKQNITEAKEEIKKLKENIKKYNQLLLIYILDSKEWYLFAFDSNKKELFCPIAALAEQLNIKNLNLMVDKWINVYTNDNHSLNDYGKKIAITHLSKLLGHENTYVSSLYFPMIRNLQGRDQPILDSFKKKYINIVKWLDEIIFCIMDEEHKSHILRRKELIHSARDQDGGGHFDLKLKVISYYKSKMGEKIGEQNGKDITTKNFHLIMLRQLGYEILNSPSINEYIKDSHHPSEK